MTHTPASTPALLVTTPPMSSASMATCADADAAHNKTDAANKLNRFMVVLRQLAKVGELYAGRIDMQRVLANLAEGLPAVVFSPLPAQPGVVKSHIFGGPLMSGGGKPGTTCGSQLGADYIDSGTLIRSRSGAPGPLGMVLQMAIGALPENDEEKQRKLAHQSMFEYDIGEIEKAKIPEMKDKAEIVAVLRALNRELKIQYGDTLEDSRGDWDGSIVYISSNYEAKLYPTMIELVHEGSHALTTQRDARKGAKKPSAAAEELQSQVNQLLMYSYLKKTRNYDDQDMERRLKDLASGKLQKDIEARLKKP
jgi:hypothetical protein